LNKQLFGNCAIVLFLACQILDGLLTYFALSAHGPQLEGNPIIRLLISFLGIEAALILAKAIASGFGMILHLIEVHTAIALLSALYLALAVVPWTLFHLYP
jgi:hypothetical protein